MVHPLEIPDRIDNLPHAYGEFVVRFLGTKEHAYVSHGRVFTFREGDRPNTGAMGNSTRKSFAAGTFTLTVRLCVNSTIIWSIGM